MFKVGCDYSDQYDYCEIERKFNELIDKRDEVNASDRGEVFYACSDDPDESQDCLYGTEDESECTHLYEGKHPKDCKSAKRKMRSGD